MLEWTQIDSWPFFMDAAYRNISTLYLDRAKGKRKLFRLRYDRHNDGEELQTLRIKPNRPTYSFEELGGRATAEEFALCENDLRRMAELFEVTILGKVRLCDNLKIMQTPVW